ncbi:multicopper oxidase family protein [Zooshikella harenae]|uniref:Multicopper oxidase domain-containing protein n=1 Tax=Zooshikella harenae TaxID=2827238 RepID=A0ABS5Z8Y5_9GAMM|nr:multicopper oxidase domain-containing protein [Zooshikella harenae]MBU2709786.1 multicopper oxidase domain-containing protein [Zooshikella harenae]
MERRDFIKYGAVLSSGAALTSAGISVIGHSKSLEGLTYQQKKAIADYNPLCIPPLLYSPYTKRYRMPTLYIQDTQHEFYPGKKSYATGISTLQHHCSYLGPTIKVKRGDVIDFSIVNLRSEPVTNHWHGLHIPGRLDGGPHQMIHPGETWNISMPIHQEAATCWYHDHTCGKTAEQVYFGHAGMFIIEDKNSYSLGLPDIYGVNDIPIVLQDKLFDDTGQQIYDRKPSRVFVGDTYCINGVANSFISVMPGLVRFRILNASNARPYNLFFNDTTFYVIASDGGFLNKPVQVEKILVLPGERVEIIVDFSKFRGDMLDMKAITLPSDPFDPDYITVNIAKIVVNSYQLKETILANSLRASTIQRDLITNTLSDADVSRSFELMVDDDLSKMSINNKEFDMKFINEEVKIGMPEIWEIKSLKGGHNFHVHGCSFLVLELYGEEPDNILKGWKDTISLPKRVGEMNEGEYHTCKILVKFNHNTYRKEYMKNIESRSDINYHIPYMYHCHVLEHEDKGMMGQFIVY